MSMSVGGHLVVARRRTVNAAERAHVVALVACERTDRDEAVPEVDAVIGSQSEDRANEAQCARQRFLIRMIVHEERAGGRVDIDAMVSGPCDEDGCRTIESVEEDPRVWHRAQVDGSRVRLGRRVVRIRNARGGLSLRTMRP